MENGQTNPQAVTVTPEPATPLASQSGTAAARLAGTGNRVNFGSIGNLPTRPTPITPVRRK